MNVSELGSHIEPNERVTFRVLYQDEHLVVVEKPARVVTMPGIGHEHDTLLNGLYARFGDRLRQLGVARDHGLVHRLDRETSGVLAVALSHEAYDGLRARFEQRETRKFYWAVTMKAPREPEGVIRRSIEEVLQRKDRYTSTRTARLSNRGKPALTAYRVLSESDLGAVIEARPVTGRLHQVRVHLASVGAGVLGDDTYGPRRTNDASPRLALHAHRLAFDHPVTGEPIDVRSAWPKDLRSLLKRLDLPRPDLDERDTVSDEGADEVGGDSVGEEEAGVGE
ncbi:MAG: RluA family pseudouridine synthase [Planctomycetota bacterium]|nr:MAG: RluA family pseudouridine synthase [Planctomycetota bacterium]